MLQFYGVDVRCIGFRVRMTGKVFFGQKDGRASVSYNRRTLVADS